MTMITVDFSEEENKKIGILKAVFSAETKADVVKKLVQLYKINEKDVN